MDIPFNSSWSCAEKSYGQPKNCAHGSEAKALGEDNLANQYLDVQRSFR
jgi:hypothetical protein